MNRIISLVLAAALIGVAAPASAGKRHSSVADQAFIADQDAHSFSVPASGLVEVAFSPNEGSEHLVIKVIDSASSELHILAYSFTSVPVTQALVRALHRGVAVRLIADEKENISQDHSRKARAALGTLSAAGADVRTISVYPIQHDKVIVADGQTVELGSFNYSQAAVRNSENVLVNWNNAKLAAVYLDHFNRNYRKAEPFRPSY